MSPSLKFAIHRALWAGCTVAALGFGGTAGAATSLQILHASDLEGGVNAIEDAPRFAAIVEALEQDAAGAGIPSVLISAGDNYIPGPFFSAAADPALQQPLRDALDNPNARSGVGRVDAAILNILGFDASALGNHEFDAGTGTVREIIGVDARNNDIRWLGVQFPYLSSNLDFSADANLAPVFTGSLLASTAFRVTRDAALANPAAANATPKISTATFIERGGETFGVVGGTTPLLAAISSPGATSVKNPGAGSNDMDAFASLLQPEIDKLLAAGVNKIIVVTHLQQIALEQALAGKLSGVDVIIAGGSDTLLADDTDVLRPGDTAAGPYPLVATNKDGDPVLIVSTDGQYSYVGRLVVAFDADGKVIPGSVDANVSGAYAAIDSVVADLWGAEDAFADGTKAERVSGLTEAVKGVVTVKDGNVFGNSTVFLDGRREAVRQQETNFGNLSADANLAVAKAYDPAVKVSLKNGGGIRAPIGEVVEVAPGEYEFQTTQANPLSGKAAGEVSQLDIENTLRFNNGLSLVTLTAEGLKAIVEHGVAATVPGATPGQFPQVGGMQFSFDPTRAPGDRVRTLALVDERGDVLDVVVRDGLVRGNPARSIRMVTLNFLAGGGDSYPFPSLATERVDLVVPGAPVTGTATFAGDGSEQDALAEYLAVRHDSATPFRQAETPVERDERIQNLAARPDGVPTRQITGGPRVDNLRGGAGNDRIIGLGGADVLFGGPGADQFVYTGLEDGGDWIMDFQPGLDRIVLTELLDEIGYTGADPLADGVLTVVQRPWGSELRVPGLHRPLARVRGVAAAALAQPANFIY